MTLTVCISVHISSPLILHWMVAYHFPKQKYNCYLRFSRNVSLRVFQFKLWLLNLFEESHLWSRDLDTKKIRAEIFGQLRNVVLEKNGEDKMVRESN